MLDGSWELAVWAALSLVLLLPTVWAWRLARLFPPSPASADVESSLPSAAVVLTLRGADPSLPECLRGLMNLDYSRYAVWIVVDNRADPAWSVVQAVLSESPASPIHVRVLEHPRPTCSLKLSAQLQAIAELESSHEVVALIDADIIPARDWLRNFVTPLLDERVGASTGIRWYTPVGTNMGTLVRYMWNAMAITQMHAFGIPWGGSLAFRTDVLREAGLLEQWSRSFCEDTSSPDLLRRQGLLLKTVPAAVVASLETTTLTNCFTFIGRQLICARMHFSRWPLLVVLNFAWVVAFAALLLAALAAALLGEWRWAFASAGTCALFLASLIAALLHLERSIRRLSESRGVDFVGFSLSPWTFLAILLTQAIFLACLVSATFARSVHWRGICYRLGRGGRVEMVEYRPFQPAGDTSDSHRSL